MSSSATTTRNSKKPQQHATGMVAPHPLSANDSSSSSKKKVNNKKTKLAQQQQTVPKKGDSPSSSSAGGVAPVDCADNSVFPALNAIASTTSFVDKKKKSGNGEKLSSPPASTFFTNCPVPFDHTTTISNTCAPSTTAMMPCVHCGGVNPYAAEGWGFCSPHCEEMHSMGNNGRSDSVSQGSDNSGSFTNHLMVASNNTAITQHTNAGFTNGDGLSSVSSVHSHDELIHQQQLIGGSTPPPQQLLGNSFTPMMAMPLSACVCCTKPCGRTFCSKRCEWSAACCCPQCGRGRDPIHSFCGVLCASQASQANWCPACGVRQTIPGTGYCGPACAQSYTACTTVVLPRRHTVMVNRNRTHNHLAPEDRMHQTLVSQFNAAFNTKKQNNSTTATTMDPTINGSQVVAVIRISPDTLKRKAFLSYRGVVEQQLVSAASGQRVAKYGHGGEGNEQKRFFPVQVACDLAASVAANAGGRAPQQRQNNEHQQHQQQHRLKSGNGWGPNKKAQEILGPVVQLCGRPDCEACGILHDGGFSLGRTGAGSHYCTSSISSALPWTLQTANINNPNEESTNAKPLRAVIQSRVVIGMPHIVADSTEVCLPPIDSSVSSHHHHTCVVSNGVESEDGTYVFSDEAVDPQYLVLFQ